jgi:membrane protein
MASTKAESDTEINASGEPGAPDDPTDLRKRNWKQLLKRTLKEFQDDNLTDWAAALTYYAVLALFPALLVLVALLGLVGQYPQTTNSLLDIVGKLGPSSAVDTFRKPIEGVVQSKGGAGALLGFGLLGALWSASGYIGAFFRASNIVWDIEEGRPVWKLLPLRVVVTLVGVLAVAVVLIGLVLTGPLAQAVGDVIGLGSTAVTVWNIAKWPVLLGIVITIISVLYYIAPNVKHPKFSWVTPGGIVAVLVWIVASVGFAFYAANFASYNKTYGSLGAMIVFLVWLWITNLAILFGAELNAELERSRQIAEDPSAAEREPFLPARAEPKS